MRVTFITPPPNFGGGIRVIGIHARNLRRRGHQVQIAYPEVAEVHSSGLRGFWQAAKRAALDPPLHGSHFDGLDVPCTRFAAGRPPTQADIPHADVVVATWWETAEWVARLPLSHGAKAYFVQGHETFDYLPVERVRATYRMPLHIITVSNWLQKVMADEYGVVKTTLAPNGVDHDHFSAPARNRNTDPVIGLLYSKEHIKGSDICIQAAELARKHLSGLTLKAFGCVPRRQTILPRWAEYVQYPAQDLIPRIYASCDAWLFGSRCEGFGLPILEAMACRTPVIATPAGAAPELLRTGGGVIVSHGDIPAMADAIRRLFTQPLPEWQQMCDQAFLTARNHTWDASTDAFEAGLLRALEGNISRQTSSLVQPHPA